MNKLLLTQTETVSAVAANNNSTYFQESKEKKTADLFILVRNALQATAHCTYMVECRNGHNEASSEQMGVPCHCQMISDGIELGYGIKRNAASAFFALQVKAPQMHFRVRQDREREVMTDRSEMIDSLALS